MQNKDAIEKLNKLGNFAASCAEGANEPEFGQFLRIESACMTLAKSLTQAQGNVNVKEVKLSCYSRFKDVILDGRARHGTNPKMSEKGKVKAQIISGTVDHLHEQGYLGAPVVPEGYALVPVTPTGEMIAAMSGEWTQYAKASAPNSVMWDAVHKAMIKAANK